MHRRTVLGSVVPGVLVGSLPFGGAALAAQNTGPTGVAAHPLTGIWLVMANPPAPADPQFPATTAFAADGSVLVVVPPNQAGSGGVQFASPYVGVWEADTDRRGHFTAVLLLSGADGVFLGSVTLDGYPEVGADGQTFVDDRLRETVTIRDAAGAVIEVIPPGPNRRPVTGTRMGVGAPGFPEGTAATPAP